MLMRKMPVLLPELLNKNSYTSHGSGFSLWHKAIDYESVNTVWNMTKSILFLPHRVTTVHEFKVPALRCDVTWFEVGVGEENKGTIANKMCEKRHWIEVKLKKTACFLVQETFERQQQKVAVLWTQVTEACHISTFPWTQTFDKRKTFFSLRALHSSQNTFWFVMFLVLEAVWRIITTPCSCKQVRMTFASHMGPTWEFLS